MQCSDLSTLSHRFTAVLLAKTEVQGGDRGLIALVPHFSLYSVLVMLHLPHSTDELISALNHLQDRVKAIDSLELAAKMCRREFGFPHRAMRRGDD